MAFRNSFVPEGFYHLYNRGTDKRNIFSRPVDYERFLALLYLSNGTKPIRIDNFSKYCERGETLLSYALEQDRGKSLVDICVYCLMPNHFHLLVTEKDEGGVSKFMQKLTTGYTMYFNKRYERNGTLFQGVFKSSLADNDRYLKYLLSYIHLNPVKLIDPKWKEDGIADKKAAKKFLRNYPYSSYLDYCGRKREESALIVPFALPQYFPTVKEFETEILEWLSATSM